MSHYGITHGEHYSTHKDIDDVVRYILDNYGIAYSRFMEIYDKVEALLSPTGKFVDQDLGLKIVRYNYGIKYP